MASHTPVKQSLWFLFIHLFIYFIMEDHQLQVSNTKGVTSANNLTNEPLEGKKKKQCGVEAHR